MRKQQIIGTFMVWLAILGTISGGSFMLFGWYVWTHDSCMDDYEASEKEMKFNCAHILQSEKPGSPAWRETLQMTLFLIEGDRSLKPEAKKSILNAHKMLGAKPSNHLLTAIRTYLQGPPSERDVEVKVRRSK